MDNFKKVLNFLIGKNAIIIILIVLFLLTILLPASYYFITIDDGEWEDSELGNPSNYTQNVQIQNDLSSGGLTVDKDKIIRTALKEKEYTDEDINNMDDEKIIDKLKINEKLHKNPKVTSLNDVSQAEIMWCLNDVYSKYLKEPEELERLLNAEIITQYPKIGQAEGKLDGIIRFERHKNDGTSAFLSYVDKDTFYSYVGNNDTKALDYFTLDEQGNALIAYSNTTTETLSFNDSEINMSEYTTSLNESNKQSNGNYSKTTTTVSIVAINYKSVVEKYTMPFNYLWSLLVIGEDKDFVLELANLVENSEITISVYDNITTTEDVNTYTYKKETRTDKHVRLFVENTYGLTGFATERYWLSKDSPEAGEQYNSKYEASYNTDSTNYTITHTVINKTNSVVYDLTKANVWIVNYSKEYSYPQNVTPTVESNSVDLDNTDYILNSETSKTSNEDSSLLNDSDAVEFSNSINDYIVRNANTSSSKKQSTNKSSSRATNSIRQTSNKTSGGSVSSNSSSDSTIEETEDVVIEPDVRVSFVEIKNYDHNIDRKQTQTITTTEQKYIAQTPINTIKDDKNAEEDNFVKILCKKEHKGAKNFLTDGTTTSWLWEIMEKNVPDMIDLTKYLFYKVTGKSFGVDTYDFSEYAKNDFVSVGSVGGSLSLTTSVLNREDFIAAMNAYSNKISGTKKSNFDSNFLPYAGDIYDWSKEYGVNPELVVITAATEQSFASGGGSYNYWGISVINGSSSGSSFSSLKDGIKGYADVIKSFQTGSKAETIKARAIERQAAGVDSTGYGSPDTLSGMQSIYSFLGNHVEGSSGAGGYYYMDPARAGVTKIYKTHEEFLSLCKNSGKSEHAEGTTTTVWEQGQYTAWQVEQKLDVWNYIFGDYGSLSGGNSEIVEIAKTKLGCPYVLGAKGPDSFDCSGFVYWVYKQKGIEVPLSTSSYKSYMGSTNEIDWTQAQPGDILLIFDNERSSGVGHAAIYLGNDEYIHAPQTGDVVKISKGAAEAFNHVFRFQ